MTGGAERKYTERDVRENPDFEKMVEDYLRQYQGEFEFLIDNKMRVAQGISLTTGMIKGVLNCMRHDVRVVDLPQPLPVDDNVVVFPNHRKKTRRRVEPHHCGLEDSHERHYDEKAEETCIGTPYLINRPYGIKLSASVNLPYVKAPGGKLIHTVDRNRKHASSWVLEDGITKGHEYGNRYLCKVYVKTLCPYPSWVDAGYLMDEDQAHEYHEQVGNHEVEFCPHCRREQG